MEIGKRVQKLRREKDLTQEQVAAALGVTSAAVSKWETGAAIPDVSMLCPLARLLGSTVDALLDFRPALEEGEIDALLEDRRKLFEENRLEEAAASCEALLRQGRPDEAMADLTEYVDRSMAQWARLNSGAEIHSAFYDKLGLHSSGMSATYLAKYVRAALEQSDELGSLREREDFQALLAKLAEAETQ